MRSAVTTVAVAILCAASASVSAKEGCIYIEDRMNAATPELRARLNEISKARKRPKGFREGAEAKRVVPEYPREAKKSGIQGVVRLQLHVGTDGAVQDLTILEGPEPLVGSTAEAFRKWRFKPWRLDGVDQEMLAVITVHYRLMDDCAPLRSGR